MARRSTSHSPPISSRLPDTIEHLLNQEPKAESIGDREQRAVATLLTQFKALVSLAATPTNEGATKEVAATEAFQMEVESSALVSPSQPLSQKVCINLGSRFVPPRISFN